MLHLGVIFRLRRLVRNYLWAGSDGTHDTRARVAWHTCILPREEGGLGIIDPEMQGRALLPSVSFVVYSLGMSLGNIFFVMHYFFPSHLEAGHGKNPTDSFSLMLL